MNGLTGRVSPQIAAGIAVLEVLTAVTAGAVAPVFAQDRGNGGYGSGQRGGGDREDRDRGGERRREEARVSWSDISSKPKFDTKSAFGYYLWREGDMVYLSANGRNGGRDTRFSGEASVPGGSVRDVSGHDSGSDDSIRKVGSNRVVFTLRTGKGIDGLKFNPDGGNRIRLSLQTNGKDAERIHLAGRDIDLRRGSLVIER